MPEGPETRRAADRVSRGFVIENSRICGSHTPQYLNLRRFWGAIVSNPLRLVEKPLLIRFKNGLSLYSHSQLYGRWTVNKVGTEVRWNRSLRAEFVAGGYAVRLWSATEVEVLPTADEEKHPYILKPGPRCSGRGYHA